MAWNEVWDKVFREQEWGKYPSEELIRFVARSFYKAPNRKDIRILEIGCGPGGNLWYMAREGFTVFGIDGSNAAIEIAKQRLDQECSGWNGELLVGDFLNLPYQDGFFDAVIDNEAVYCNSFEESKHIYSEVKRVLKLNGQLFIRTFATGTWGDSTGKQLGHHYWEPSEGPLAGKGQSRFTEQDEIQQLLEGFRDINIEQVSRTINHQEHAIREWIVISRKL